MTFWGRGYGVLVVRSEELRRNLYWTEVENETLAAYQEARQILEQLGFTLKAIVIDGKQGLKAVFADIPVQICHFHQLATIRRYLTSKPKLEAGKELRIIALALPDLTETVFTQLLNEWYGKWQWFLKERTINLYQPKTWFYTHKRIRSAYRSLKINLLTRPPKFRH